MFPPPTHFSALTTHNTINSSKGDIKPRFCRHKSTNDLITNIEQGHFPTLENFPILKESVKGAFHRAGIFFNKQNRDDVPMENNRPGALPIGDLRLLIYLAALNMSEEEKKVLNDMNRKGDYALLQHTNAKLITHVYQQNKKGAPTYCGEITYLVYYLLCQQGIAPGEMRVVCFENEDHSQNHALIIYCSDQDAFNYIENYCGVGESKVKNNSYACLIDWLVSIDKKQQPLLIIDPWSRDNKIVDPLLVQEDEVFLAYQEAHPNEPDSVIERKFLAITLNSILVESGVVPDTYPLTDDSRQPPIDIYVDLPIVTDDADSSSDSSSSSYKGR